MSDTIQKYKDYVMTGFMKSVVPIVIDKASGATVTDINGREYLDCFAGISVVNAGHCNPQRDRRGQGADGQAGPLLVLHLSRAAGGGSGRKDCPHRAPRPDQDIFRQRRRRSHRRRHEAGAALHRQTRIHCAARQLSRTQLGRAQRHRQHGTQKARRPVRRRGDLCARSLCLSLAMAERSGRMRTAVRPSHRGRNPVHHCRRRGGIHRRAGHGRRRNHRSARRITSKK